MRIWLVVLGVALLACGGEVSGSSSAGAGGSTSPSAASTSSSGGSTSSVGGGSSICGGLAGIACSPDAWCDFEPSYCGGDDSTGICKERPSACEEIYMPVCGCDGNVYDNPCFAEGSGVDVSLYGGCTPPPGTFACGASFCDLSFQYCEVLGSDVPSEPTVFQCKPLPPGCSTLPECGCFAGELCYPQCEGTPATGFTLTCPGG